jgi:hypothetical protein
MAIKTGPVAFVGKTLWLWVPNAQRVLEARPFRADGRVERIVLDGILDLVNI